MVIEFPTVDLGGASSTKGGAPEGGEAFASLVEGLLADESSAPEDVDADLDSANEVPPPDPAGVPFVIPVPFANVPPLKAGVSGDTDDPNASSSDPSQEGPGLEGSLLPSGAVNGLGANAFGVSTDPNLVGRGGTQPSAERSPDAAGVRSAFFRTSPEASSPLVGEESALGAISPGPVASESLFGDPSAESAVAFDADSQLPAAASAESAVPAEAVDPAEGEGAARKDFRGYFERSSASSADTVSAQLDAVQRMDALVESGQDFGSSAREGSRDGAQTAAGTMLNGAAATSTPVGSHQATWLPASQPDDVVLPQLVRAMRLQLVGGVGEARIQLDPKHLGAVTVNLRVDGGVVSAVVMAEQSAVRHLIENHETSLKQALAEQGLFLDKLHVERDGRPPGEHPSQSQEDAPRRRSMRKETATFELLA